MTPALFFRHLTFCLAVGSMVLAAARTAHADYIDLTDPIFAGAHGQPSFGAAVDGVGLFLEPSPDEALLYWDNLDGLGVQDDYENDEIEGSETLLISFTTGPVYLTSVALTDLFFEGGIFQGDSYVGGYFEEGSYQLNGGPWVSFIQHDPTVLPSPTTNGTFTIPVHADGVSSIAFRAPGYQYDAPTQRWQHHEYSVAGLHVSVPEPSTLALLSLGLLSNAITMRRRRDKPSRSSRS